MNKKSKKDTFVATVKGGIEHPKIVGSRKVGNHTVKVAEVEHKIKGGYIGLNMEAAKQLGIKTNIPYNEIVRFKGSPKWQKEETTRHELIEEHAVRYGRLCRHDSHLLALAFEDTDVTPKEALRWYKAQQAKKHNK